MCSASRNVALRTDLETLNILVLITYTITLVKTSRIVEDTNLSSLKSTHSNQIKSKSWQDFRNQLHGNVFTMGTLGQLHRNRRSVMTLQSTNSRKAQILACKFQNYNLAIMNNGRVLGLKNQSSPDVLLDLERYNGGLTTIQHTQSKRYIAMNSNGTVYSTTTFSDEVLFRYLTGNYPYIQFSSYKYKHNGKDMLIGIRSDGHMKKGRKVAITHKSSKFLMMATV